MPATVYIGAVLWVLSVIAVVAILAWHTLRPSTPTDRYCSALDDELDAEARLAEALNEHLERRRVAAIRGGLDEIGFVADSTWSRMDLGGAA